MRGRAFDLLPGLAFITDGTRVVHANAACVRALGETDLQGRELSSLIDVESVETLTETLSRACANGETLRWGFRGGADHASNDLLAIELRVARLDEEHFVMSGHRTESSARLETTIGRLAGIYSRANEATIADISALLQDSRSVFEALSWNVALVRVLEEEVALEHVLYYEEDQGPAAVFMRGLIGRSVPMSDMPNVARVVASGVGHFVWDAPKMGADLANRTDPNRRGVADALAKDGLQRAAFAPVFVQREVSWVLMVAGRELAENDFAAVQLLAGILSAAEQVSALSRAHAIAQRHAALGQMATQLAHEVRNPLAVILQATRQLGRRVAIDAQVHQLLEMIDEEARRLETLVEDLVGYAGPLDPRLQSVNVAQLVNWSIDGCRARAGRPCAELEIAMAVPGELSVLADPRLLQLAFAHLLRNACEHAERVVEIAGASDGTTVDIHIANDGPGLEPQVAVRVFEPFFSTRPSGSGLGLAVVRRLVEDQGGGVELTSAGSPTRFTVRLPVAP